MEMAKEAVMEREGREKKGREEKRKEGGREAREREKGRNGEGGGGGREKKGEKGKVSRQTVTKHETVPPVLKLMAITGPQSW